MYTLRAATAEDLPAILALIEAAYRPWVAVLGQEPGPLHDDYAGAVARAQVTLALEDGAVRGVLVLVARGDVLLIDNVAVAPDAQGGGLGRLLMREADRRGQGFRVLQLYTHEKMAANIAFYTRLGYVESRRVTERGLARVYMEKPLTGGVPSSCR